MKFAHFHFSLTLNTNIPGCSLWEQSLPGTPIMSQAVQSTLGFLSRDAMYSTIKPYSLRFEPPDESPRHNLRTEERPVTIHDARPEKPTLDEHGFSLTTVPTKMSYTDYGDDEKIQGIYARKLQAHLKDLLAARHVRVIDYVVRQILLHSLPATSSHWQARELG